MTSALRRFAIGLLALGVLSACGSAAANSSTGSSDVSAGDNSTSNELVDFRVGLLTFSNTVPVYIAQEKGFFEEEGLNVSLREIQTGPALIAAAISGDVDVSMANSASVLQAVAQGLPLRVLAATSYANTEPGLHSGQGLYVAPDSDIATTADLRGKTIGLISVGNINDLAIKASLDQLHGYGPDDYELTGIPAADTANAIKAGHIDAGVLVEPYATAGAKEGLKFIYDPNIGFGIPEQEFLSNVWFTSATSLEKNADATEKFTRAIKKANDFTQANPDLARQTLAEIATVDPAILPDLVLPKFSSELHLEGLQNAADSMLTYGFLDSPVDISAIIVD